MLKAFLAEYGTPLSWSFDPEARLALIPRDHAIKGMFFLPRVKELGADLASITPRLLSPPRLRNYLPFSDYPQVDCARIAFAAAAKLHPDVPLAEACRRVAHRDIQTFGKSAIGATMLGLAGDLEATLLKMPDVYGTILNGVGCAAHKQPDGAVQVEFSKLWGTLDNFQIGTVEGVVLHFGEKPVIEVQMLSIDRAIYVVRWA